MDLLIRAASQLRAADHSGVETPGVDMPGAATPGAAPAGLAGLIAAFPWESTPLGPAAAWPAHLTSTVALLVQSALPIVTLWGQDGVLIYNDAYAQFAGARHPALLGANVLAGWPEVADLNTRVLAAGFAGKTLSFRDEQVTLVRHGFPETIWLDLDYSPIPAADGSIAGIFCVVRETTERVKLERQRAADIALLNAAEIRQLCLIELGDRLRGAESESDIAITVAGLIGRALGCTRAGYAAVRRNCAIVERDWTDGSIPLLGGIYEFDDLGEHYVAPLKRGEMLVVPDVRQHPATASHATSWLGINAAAILNIALLEEGAVVALLYAHQTTPRDWTSEDVALLTDIASRTWEALGRTRAAAKLRDLNETLEAQVRERTAQRDRMWTLTTDLMMVSNKSGRILSVNPAWTHLLGWREDELVGRAFYDFIHPDDRERTRKERKKLDAGLTLHKFENRYLTRDGAEIWLSWKAMPDGDIIHSVARDITAEREQAGALQAAEEALRHAQKMEAVGQLTGGLAHDFNNLLQGIVGSLDLVQKRIEQGRFDTLAEYAAQARASADRAGALTHRLLAFSRRSPIDPKPIAANPLILGMEPLLRRTIGELFILKFELDPDLWPTHCDPHQLDSAILNLVINARDAMPDGGMLTIASRNMPDAETDSICISVTDTGTGMPADVIARAFDPFYTTKPIGQGTGLGLSMVYGFMRQSGGQAKIVSAVGQGTTVKLFLPRYTGNLAPAEPGQPSAASTPEPAGSGAVLVLEDEPIVRAIVVEILGDLGYTAIEAADGPSGLEILNSPRRIDLLITDIGLPGLNGRQVAEAARQTRKNLKILFMTGYAETAAMADGFLQPGMQMITKPFAIDSLASRITAIIESAPEHL
jgi:PAS domain S-box-containing protein